MVKRVLMIAFHYPPMRGSSGIQRTLKFAQYLPRSDWQPIILSAHPRAYQHTSGDQIAEIDSGLVVRRSCAFDTARHFSLFGSYPALLALPDRWISWWLSAVPAGLRLIRLHRPDVIWSSYPIATAHLIALTLHRLTGIPWIADQRDPMTDLDYPLDLRTRRLHHWIENKIVQHCAGLVCTTHGAASRYQQRFAAIAPAAATRIRLIENGFDEDNFSSAEADLEDPMPAPGHEQHCFRLLHSGIIYLSERDPSALFAALFILLHSAEITPSNFHLTLRATGHDGQLLGMLKKYGIDTIVTLAPALPYRAALTEMLETDGLLLLQAANCNAQIPAKLYEYLRAGRPILALTDPLGDSAAKLRSVGIDTIGRLDSQEDIVACLRRFLHLSRQAKAPVASASSIAQNSRAARTIELASLLDQVCHLEKKTCKP